MWSDRKKRDAPAPWFNVPFLGPWHTLPLSVRTSDMLFLEPFWQINNATNQTRSPLANLIIVRNTSVFCLRWWYSRRSEVALTSKTLELPVSVCTCSCMFAISGCTISRVKRSCICKGGRPCAARSTMSRSSGQCGSCLEPNPTCSCLSFLFLVSVWWLKTGTASHCFTWPHVATLLVKK